MQCWAFILLIEVNVDNEKFHKLSKQTIGTNYRLKKKKILNV